MELGRTGASRLKWPSFSLRFEMIPSSFRMKGALLKGKAVGGMKPRAAITAAKRLVRREFAQKGRSVTVVARGVVVARDICPDEAQVVLVEHMARIALQMVGVPHAKELVEEALDEGVDLRTDRLVYRALALAAQRPE